MSVKYLYLLRHAQAEDGGYGQDDETRALTEKGHKDAKAVGEWMAANEHIPDLALCSSAKRTKQTLEGVASTLGDFKIAHVKQFYNAPIGTLLESIKKLPDNFNSILIVAHNPAIYELALACGKRGITSYGPATIGIVDYKGGKWRDLNFDQTRLIDIKQQH